MTTTVNPSATVDTVARGRVRRAGRRLALCLVLVALLVAAFAASLMVGQRFYGPVEVLRVILGDTVPGASFTVGELRLPGPAWPCSPVRRPG